MMSVQSYLSRTSLFASVVLACIVGISFSRPAHAQVRVFGFIAKDSSLGLISGSGRDSYMLSELSIGNVKESSSNLVYTAMIIECSNNSGDLPKWQLTYFLQTGGHATSVFYHDEQISPSSVSDMLRRVQNDHPEAGALMTINIAPGRAFRIPHFRLECFPTSDPNRPSMMRVRLFGEDQGMKDVFDTSWFPLPDIQSLPDADDSKGLQFSMTP